MEAKVKSEAGVSYIFDRFRKKYVQLTPEEWVRQHFASALVQSAQVPESLIILESEIAYGKVRKRPDIVVMKPDQSIWMLVECKAPDVHLSEAVWQQTFTYGSVLNPRIMAVTNGRQHIIYAFQSEIEKFVLVKAIPNYKED